MCIRDRALIPALTAHYPPVSAGVHQAATLSMLESPAVILAGCMLFCMVGLEVSTASWTTTYLRKLGFREQRAVLLFSMLWVAKIAGRLIASQVVTTGTAKDVYKRQPLRSRNRFAHATPPQSASIAPAGWRRQRSASLIASESSLSPKRGRCQIVFRAKAIYRREIETAREKDLDF